MSCSLSVWLNRNCIKSPANKLKRNLLFLGSDHPLSSTIILRRRNQVMKKKNALTALLGISRIGSMMRSCHGFSISTQQPKVTSTTTGHFHRSFFSSKSSNACQEKKRDDVLEICQAGLEAVDPYRAVQNHWKVVRDGVLQLGADDGSPLLEYYKEDYDRVVIVAFGKASSAMALSMAEVVRKGFGSNDDDMKIVGHVIVKDGHGSEEEWQRLVNDFHVTVEEASHPVPTSTEAAQNVWDTCQQYADERTLVVCGISGGGSALFCLPRPGITLHDLQRTNELLLQSGMSITDMNTIRIQLERGKGGKLAAHAVYPSTMATMVLSDIIGDPLHFIASGPTVPSISLSPTIIPSLLDQYQLNYGQTNALPSSVLKTLLPEEEEISSITLKDHNMFSLLPNKKGRNHKQCETVLVGNNEMAVQAAAKYASSSLGYSTIVLGTSMEGEAKHVAKVYTRMALHLSQNSSNNKRNNSFLMTSKLPLCLIAGGETTVTLDSTSSVGKGGRNQELALQAAIDLYEQQQQLLSTTTTTKSYEIPQITLASIGTDGTDGPTDAAGAIIDSSTIHNYESYQKAQIALQTHNAYPYLKQQLPESALILTGPTGTNVADLCVILIHPSQGEKEVNGDNTIKKQ